jgi:hypothetical protein
MRITIQHTGSLKSLYSLVKKDSRFEYLLLDLPSKQLVITNGSFLGAIPLAIDDVIEGEAVEWWGVPNTILNGTEREFILAGDTLTSTGKTPITYTLQKAGIKPENIHGVIKPILSGSRWEKTRLPEREKLTEEWDGRVTVDIDPELIEHVSTILHNEKNTTRSIRLHIDAFNKEAPVIVTHSENEHLAIIMPMRASANHTALIQEKARQYTRKPDEKYNPIPDVNRDKTLS